MEEKNDKGWISLYRKFNNWQWYKNANVKSLFIHLVLNANHNEVEWKNIKVLRGQIITSREHLAEDLGLSIQQIRTCLSKLESTNEIKIETTNRYTLITVINYDKYQQNKITSNSTEISTDNSTSKITNETTSKTKTESIENKGKEEKDNENITSKITNETTSNSTDKITDNSTTNNNNIIINNNNILLNYTKLNLLFNYLIYKENKFETLTESDRTTIIYRLKQLDLYFDFKDMTCFKYMTDPEEKIFEIKLYYWVITSIWISEYRMYFNNLNRNNFFFRFIKCKKYIPINSKSSEEELRHFVSYFMKSLMDELKKD